MFIRIDKLQNIPLNHFIASNHFLDFVDERSCLSSWPLACYDVMSGCVTSHWNSNDANRETRQDTPPVSLHTLDWTRGPSLSVWQLYQSLSMTRQNTMEEGIMCRQYKTSPLRRHYPVDTTWIRCTTMRSAVAPASLVIHLILLGALLPGQ